MMTLDDIDRKILKILQENARTSLKTIAEKTFLSSPVWDITSWLLSI